MPGTLELALGKTAYVIVKELFRLQPGEGRRAKLVCLLPVVIV
jgi:hypothetical protein